MTVVEVCPVVIVESPFAGDMEGNKIYARRACLDCLLRGEVPYASHLFFPQFLDELKPEQRELGLTAGYAFWPIAAKIVFYTDRGWSGGMHRAKARAVDLGYQYEERTLKNERPDAAVHTISAASPGTGSRASEA